MIRQQSSSRSVNAVGSLTVSCALLLWVCLTMVVRADPDPMPPAPRSVTTRTNSSGQEVVRRPKPRPRTGKPWVDMDYGPFLTAAIEAPLPATNIAFKGIAIPLAAAFDGSRNEAIVFDTDLLRYSVGWIGGSVGLSGVVYDGEHWAYPHIRGQQLFGNAQVPGWAHQGNFRDPRPFIYGPLPREWAHWRGLYLYDQKVILSYTVGRTEILEMPGLEKAAGLTAFTRTLNLGRSTEELVLQVASESGGPARLLSLDTLAEGAADANAARTIAVCSQTKGAEHGKEAAVGTNVVTGTLGVSLSGAPTGCVWVATPDGNLRLRIPAAATPCRLKILIARFPEENLQQFAELAQQAVPVFDLARLTHGGPARWAQTIATHGKLGADTGPYAIDTLTWPDDNFWNSWMRFGAFDFFKDSTRAAITTWSGDVWIVSGIDDKLESLTWRRFATGLYEPLGLKIVDDQIYVLGRDQITRLHDLDGDGEADWYENYNNDTQNSEHFHEFIYDLQLGPDGDFYYLKGARHARDALHPQHGTLNRVSRDGLHSEILANGFRAPNGLGISPAGEFYSTDQEGYWMPANRLNLIKPGGFYGNVWSWFPDAKPTKYDPPICWIHPRVDRSPSTMVPVTSERWGPLKDQVVSLSYGVGRIFLLMQETVNGIRQGGIVPLPVEFETGIIRGRFHPGDGQLYVCGLFGWAGNKTQPGGFFRVRNTGKPLYSPSGLHALTNGIVLTFTQPLDRASATDAGNYGVEVWNYRWTQEYGSPDYKLNGARGRDHLLVEFAQLSRDGRSVFLRLPGITPVMQMNVQMNLKAADGQPIQTFVHNTIHALGAQGADTWLGEPVLAAMPQAEPQIQQEAFGLVQTLVSKAPGAEGAVDTRQSRLVALHVPAGTGASPFLVPGPFTSTWTGFVKTEVSDTYGFLAVGTGRVSVAVNDRVVIPAGEASPASATNYFWATLKGGLNRVEVSYESPASGDARLRLLWSTARLAMEAVPPTAFVHEAADPRLRQGEARRLGRQLFADRQCSKCHSPDTPMTDGMPELAQEGPSLEGCGNRLNTAWIERWLANPAAIVPETLMPSCLRGSAAEGEAQAGDIAAALAALTGTPAVPANSAKSEDQAADGVTNVVARGEHLFASLGCVACHFLPGDHRLAEDTRRPLGHVQAKWKPAALREFLRAPTKYYTWNRMPDFQLTAPEADALASYVISRGEPAQAGSPNGVGDPAKGRQALAALGCVNCHSIPGVDKTSIAGGLATLAGKEWTKGCLADAAAARGTAPDFNLTSPQREALRLFLRNDLPSLGRDAWPEFANRQVTALRCTACHQREGGSDFWFAIESTDPAKAAKATNPYDEDESQDKTIHRTRPPLMLTGEKLRPEWVAQFLSGTLSYKPRTKLDARMPAFPAYARGLALGLALDHGMDTTSPALEPINAEWANAGKALIQKGALGCVDCHAVGSQAALAGKDTATINFAHIPDRLLKSYYDRYVLDPQRLLPGTMMPKFVSDEGLTGITAHFGGDGRSQFEAIWNYMRTVQPSP